MFIRFVIKNTDAKTGRRQGLFAAAGELRDSGRLSAEDDHHLEALRGWFNKNLAEPTRLAASSKANKKPQAISWFKDSAQLHISRIREIQEMLERYGIGVDLIKADRIGYLVYEDAFQACAIPFSDTPT